MLYEARNGTLWAGCFNGLNKLDKETGRFKKYFNQTRIFQVFEDRAGTLWAATLKGLFSDMILQRIIFNFKDPSGTLSSAPTVFWVEEDDAQNFWMNTTRGILKQKKKKNEAVLFGKNQGVNPLLVGQKGWVRQNGDILYAENSGYYTLNKSLLQLNTSLPVVNITNFLLDDIPVQPSSNGILTTPPEQTNNIRLKHNQNTFAFEFSNIDFISSHEDTRLLYMMENYDNNWRVANESRSAYYFNLSSRSLCF